MDLGDLQKEGEHLASFLKDKMKINPVVVQNKLVVNEEKLSPPDLERFVNKFVYRQNLNTVYWVSLEKNTIKINRFRNKDKKPEKKQNKRRKNAKTASNITQSWGL